MRGLVLAFPRIAKCIFCDAFAAVYLMAGVKQLRVANDVKQLVSRGVAEILPPAGRQNDVPRSGLYPIRVSVRAIGLEKMPLLWLPMWLA